MSKEFQSECATTDHNTESIRCVRSKQGLDDANMVLRGAQIVFAVELTLQSQDVIQEHGP